MPKNHVPTEPGYYWHRDIDEGHGEAFEWEPVRVLSEQDGPGIIIDGTTYQASELHTCEWGPRIPNPEELQEKAEADAALDAAVERSIKSATDMIRDNLAERFIVGLLAHRGVVCPTHPTGEVSGLVTDAYAIADAMMAERENRQ